MLRRVYLFLLPVFAGAGAFGLLSVSFGKDMNADFLNYHYYNPYALLTWRYDLDFAPAGIQSYYSPALYVPWYLMMQHLPSRAVGFITGAIQGLNFSVVFWIAWRIVRQVPWRTRVLVAWASATLGCLAPAFLLELGTQYHDTTLSVLVLAAVALLLETVRGFPGLSRPAVAGALMGATVGLKLTNVVYALSSALALLVVLGAKRTRPRVLVVYGLSGFCTVACVQGPWMWFLWDRFGNPVFPYYNSIFQSPQAYSHRDFLDFRYFPDTFWEYPIWPLLFSVDSLRVGEFSFTDYRFALLWLVGVAYCIVAVCRRPWSRPPGEASEDQQAARAAENFLFAFTFFGFYAWVYLFSIYRYLAPLELLAPLVCGLVLARMGFSPKVLAGVLAGLGVLSLLVLDVPTLSTRLAWDEKYVQVNVGKLEHPAETVVLMLGGIAYVIPEFPPQVRFLQERWWERGLSRDFIRKTLEAHTGPILLMVFGYQPRQAFKYARERFGLTVFPDSCRLLENNANSDITLCRAAKLDGPDG